MELTDLKKIPHSIESEQCIIGSVLIDPNCINEIADTLNPQHFYVEKYGQIYEIMMSMFLSNKSIDFVTVLEAIKSQAIFDEEEGKRVFYEMTQLVPSTKNILEYAKIVVEKASLRRLIEACADISAECYSQSQDATTILDMAERRIYDIMQSRSNTALTHIKHAIIESYDKINKVSQDKNAFLGIQTGYSEIDRMMTGLGKSDLVLIAARPGVGKTSFALNIAQNVALQTPKKTIAIFSLEMSNDQLANRMLSAQSGIDNMKFRNGEIGDDEWVRLAEASVILSDTDVYFDDTAGITVAQMKAKLRRLKNLDLIIIDYLQLMSGSKRYENRSTEVGDISRSLKVMAKEFNVPVICLSQLNRETEKTKQKPQLSNLRESGSIEQDADAILFLWKEDDSEENQGSAQVVKCDVAKNRHGPVGSVDLVWKPELTRFFNMAKMD